MDILKLLKRENEGLRIAVYILLNRGINKGDEIDFIIKDKHYILIRVK